MRIVVGSDERTALTDAVIEDLRKRGHELSLIGPLSGDESAWPEVARRAAEQVASGRGR